MRNARAHKLQWSGPTVHSSTVTGCPKKELTLKLFVHRSLTWVITHVGIQF